MYKLNFQFNEYKLEARHTSFIDPLMMFIAEILGMEGYRETIKFSFGLEEPELLLERKEDFTVAGGVIPGRAEAADFKIRRWTYAVNKATEPEFNVYLEEVKPPPIERLFARLSADNKSFLVVLIIVLVPALIAFGVYAVVFYPDPGWLWEFIGRNVQWMMALILMITTLGLLIWLYRKNKKSSIAQEFIGRIGGVLIFAVPILWVLIAAPPEGIVTREQPIAYLNYLRNQFLTNLLLLAGIVPWLTIFLKYFGWDLAVAILGQLTKKDKS